jgi:hypothetical protein
MMRNSGMAGGWAAAVGSVFFSLRFSQASHTSFPLLYTYYGTTCHATVPAFSVEKGTSTNTCFLQISIPLRLAIYSFTMAKIRLSEN